MSIEQFIKTTVASFIHITELKMSITRDYDADMLILKPNF